MALIPCKNCGKTVSSSAKKCPHCQTELNGFQSTNTNKTNETASVPKVDANSEKQSKLIPCPKCSKNISPSAKTCPYCKTELEVNNQSVNTNVGNAKKFPNVTITKTSIPNPQTVLY